MRRRSTLAGACAALLARTAWAQPLSPAQLALFETAHLATLEVPVRLDYEFIRDETGREPVADRISLEVRAGAEAGRRDVAAEFLTGPRNLPYPRATGFRGNPLLLFALDRDARELAAATGGSMHFFRERIRRAFATAAVRQDVELAFEGRLVAAAEFTIQPFGGEPRARRFQNRRYAFMLADAVPGMIHLIRSDTPPGEGTPALRESITFRAAVPLPAEGRP